MGKKITQKEALIIAKTIHGDKYDYSLMKYKGMNKKIKIICPIHGEFEQKAYSHLRRGYGCPICGGSKKSNTEEFIEKAREIHGDKYDYSLVEYKNMNTKVKIICPIHGEFWQKPNKHIYRSFGCPKCGIEKRSKAKSLGIESFIEKAKEIHKDWYDYSLVEYKNNKDKIKIICPIHGEFWQSADNHLVGHGCPSCSNNKPLTTDEFIKRAKELHGNTYNYSQTKYIKMTEKVKIICSIHGEFWQDPQKHITFGNGCPICRESHGEKKIRVFLEKNNIEFEMQKIFDDLKYINHLKYDFYLPEYNLLIEFDGEQHFNEDTLYWNEDIQIRDEIKNEYAFDYGYYLIRIGYWEIEEIENILSKLI